MQKLNTTAVYILSVLGFICCCIGLGWIPALIAFIMANNGLKKYNLNSEMYSNGKAMKSAKTVALIALIISSIVFIGLVIFALSFDSRCEFYEWYIEFAQQNPNVTDEQLAPLYEAMEQEGCI